MEYHVHERPIWMCTKVTIRVVAITNTDMVTGHYICTTLPCEYSTACGKGGNERRLDYNV
jgi:hypothetical protein